MLVANSTDQDLKNHLGTAKTRTPDQEATLSPMIKQGLLSQHLADLFAAQGRLRTPLECIQQNRNGRWNEVIIAGRSPTTGRGTTVSAFFYRVGTNHRYYIAKGGTRSPITPVIERWIDAASRVFGLPIIYIPDSSGHWG